MPADRAVTLQDIADRVGVTRSTASYAITGRGRVSERTKRRVLAAAEELGYRPNILARRLRDSRTGVLALRFPRYTGMMSYYMAAVLGAAEEAERAGMILSLITVDMGDDEVSRLHADGVILLDPDGDDATARALLSGRLPVVTGEDVPPGFPPGRGAVVSDHAGAVDSLMDHLADRGARNTVLIMPDIGSAWAITVRAAFETWCADRGASGRVVMIPHPAKPEEVRRRVERLLRGPERVDAIMAGSDGIVLNIVTSAEAGGRSVGRDLLVATVVDSEILTVTHPSVTALELHPREFGRRCVRSLLAMLETDPAAVERAPVRDIVEIDLRLRESTQGVVLD